MFGVEGFEPPHGGTKNRCLTAWRHPISRTFVCQLSQHLIVFADLIAIKILHFLLFLKNNHALSADFNVIASSK